MLASVVADWIEDWICRSLRRLEGPCIKRIPRNNITSVLLQRGQSRDLISLAPTWRVIGAQSRGSLAVAKVVVSCCRY